MCLYRDEAPGDFWAFIGGGRFVSWGGRRDRLVLVGLTGGGSWRSLLGAGESGVGVGAFG